MSSITKRAFILVLCRMMNYGVMLLSPMFLVRIFDMRSYGMYREFVVYAMLLAGLIGFGINTNLLYFIPKYPGRERRLVSHSALLVLGATILGLVLLFALRGVIVARTSFNFVIPLMIYIALFINLDFFESYWLGRKRTDYVLYFSSARVTVRTVAVVAAAWITRDVDAVIRVMIAVELAKCLLVAWLFRGFFEPGIERSLMREQLRFIVPLGSSAAISLVNTQLANLFISLRMGVERLALYTIGGQQIPVINIVRSSVMDVLFPEMTQTDEAGRLGLWRRANVVFVFMVAPVYAVFFTFADTFISSLYTSQYLAAVPLFRIYLTIMVLQCFEMGTPLRAMNENKYFILGSVITLGVNIGLIAALFPSVGFVAPAAAYVAGEITAGVYLAWTILRLYRIGVARIFSWRKLGRIALAAILTLPILMTGKLLRIQPDVQAVVFSCLYAVVYFFVIRQFRIEEVEILVEKVRGRLRRR